MFEWATIDGLGSLLFEEVLIEYGIPELFVCRDKEGAPCLVLLLDESYSYYIVRLTQRELLKLLLDKDTLNAALFSHDKEAWLYDLPNKQSKKISPDEIADDLRYEDDAFLNTKNEDYLNRIMALCLG